MERRWMGLRGLAVGLLLAGIIAVPGPAPASSHLTYVEMSDGVKIAIAVGFPTGFDPDRPDGWPALFMMDGYAGGASAVGPGAFGHNYVTVHASIRGTGCSGGHFDLFDRRHAWDGHEIIENWIVRQGWSNGRVGIIGHSYPGLTGWMVASTDPPSVDAIAISGLIDDLYRGIVYPGGVPNYGFPALWTGAYRPAFEHAGNASRYVGETTGGDPTCAANIATRDVADPFENPILRGSTQTADGPWWHYRSTITWIRGITKPIHITHQYQDEQTGPRGGPMLWENIPEGVPKRLVLTNGVHSTTAVGSTDRLAWLDCWVRDVCAGDIADPDARVRVHFETRGSSDFNPPLIAGDFPLPGTLWTEYHLREDGTLTTDAPAAGEAPATYVATTAGRHLTGDMGFQFGNDGIGQATFFDGPDAATWELTFAEATAVAGPITLTVHASVTAPDTDFFVSLIDRSPDGEYRYLQRGMLRASHRAVDGLRSDRIASGSLAGTIFRPYRSHTSLTPIVPGAIEEYLIEVFPVGHVFRENHSLVLMVHAPPPADPLSIYAWISGQPPALVTIHQDEAHPSRLLLPVLPGLPPDTLGAPLCGQLVGVPCFRPQI